jgi:IPT/TIG domain
VSPAGSGIVNVTVTTPEGPSAASPTDLFSYLPSVTGVAPSSGPQAGGTTVTITGTNFSAVTNVKFGANSAPSFTVSSATSITAVSPAGFGSVDVTVTTAGGTSLTSAADTFTYGSLAPEFGRCVKVTTGTGVYGTSGCTTVGGEKKFEWIGGPPPKAKFTTKIKLGTTFTSEGVGGNPITCSGQKGTGEYTGPKTVGGAVFTFMGCALGSARCNSAGAKEGEVVTTPLVGELGVIKTSSEGALKNEIGLDLKASGSALIAEFTCGATAGKWRGSVIVPVKTNKGISSVTLKFAAKAGKQKPEAFEGLPKDVIESSLGGAAFEQSGWSLTTTLTNAEKVEVNSVV